MYNLLMSGNSETWDAGVATMENYRFLEYTNSALKAKFESLTDAILTELMSYPCLFAYEKGIDRPARLGHILTIQRLQNSLSIEFIFDTQYDPLEPGLLIDNTQELDIGPKDEIYRTHWAVKDVDLEKVLTNLGLLVSAQPSSKIDFHFSDLTVLAATKILTALSYPQFCDFQETLGIDNLGGGPTTKAKCTALGQYATINKDYLTPDNESLATAVVKRAVSIDPNYPDGVLYDLPNSARQQFWNYLKQDGYEFREGHLRMLNTTVSQEQSALSPINTVFIVHGHDDAAKEKVARFVQRIGLEPKILHETPSGGKTLIDKFITHAQEAAFAVVLMTPDDTVSFPDGHTESRARQNVIFELGFFIGRLKPINVCALVGEGMTIPSDFYGVVHVQYSPTNDAWKTELAREFRNAGLSFDPNKVF